MDISPTLTLKTVDLARLLSVSPRRILNHRAKIYYSHMLEGLPEPMVTRPACIWLRADIEAWLETKRTYRAPEPGSPPPPPQPVSLFNRGRGSDITKRPRGRPRKVAIAAVSAGEGGAA